MFRMFNNENIVGKAARGATLSLAILTMATQQVAAESTTSSDKPLVLIDDKTIFMAYVISIIAVGIGSCIYACLENRNQPPGQQPPQAQAPQAHPPRSL